MSKSDIHSWISSSAQGSDENGPAESPWRRENVLQNWTKSLEFAQAVLMESRTSVRVAFLREELLPLAKTADLNLSQVLDVFKLLTLTYPRYTDGLSREAVENVGMELVRRDELRGTEKGAIDEQKMGVTEQILGWLSHEVSRLSKRGSASSYAPSDLYVLLSWSCGLYMVCLETNASFTESQPWSSLVNSMALLLDMIFDSERAKPTLKNGALVHVRRALRSAGDKLPNLISTLLAHVKSSQNPIRFIQLIGVAISVQVRLKNTKEPTPESIDPEIKSQLVSLYCSSILMAKNSVPTHTLTSFHDIIKYFFNKDDFSNSILPTAEKALLRSPEYSLDVVADFFSAYSQLLDTESFKRVLVQAINSAKSSNPATRAGSVKLFKAIMSVPTVDSSLLSVAVIELLALPKANKTAGPDHRVALYSMLAVLPPSSDVSSAIAQGIAPLLAKESHEGAMSILAAALPDHVGFLLKNNVALPPDFASLVVKEMGSLKPPVRRAFCSLAGSALWSTADGDMSETTLDFAKTVLPGLENSLKNVASNPLGSSAGPLEAYIAVSVMLGPLSRSGKFDDIISRNAVLQAITTTSAKPSFLIWEKVYQKLTDAEDEKWLLRACDASLIYFQSEMLRNEGPRTQLGLAFLHLAVNGNSPDVRRNVNAALAATTVLYPRLTNSMVHDAVAAFLSRFPSTPSEDVVWNKHSRVAGLLLSAAAFGSEVDVATREDVVVDSLILTHHYLVSAPSKQTWIDLCQKAGTDPRELIGRNLDKLVQLVLSASSESKSGFSEASYRAVTTLAFVSPESVLPRIVDQLRDDINVNVLNSLTDFDFGVWSTPEGTTYVDVLSSTKNQRETKKGKDAEIAKWEADVRKTLANKKASAGGTVALTKQQQVLVQEQMSKESDVRKRVNLIKASLDRGLQFISSLINASVPEFRVYISSIVTLLLDGALSRGALLAGDIAFETYLKLASCCSERLDTFRRWMGIATLRCLRENVVPEELRAEPLSQLVLRVLHRLRFSSEQAPFDAATFSYIFPLIGHVVQVGGLPSEEADEMLEQVAVSQDIVKFHCGEFSDMAFPRLPTMEILIHIVRQQPKLSKEASSTLIELGEAIQASAQRAEIDTLIRGTLFQEVYVRNSCLQALQPFDLTDLDWSPELWIACHDDDEQNARLAHHVWEDNGLDVPQSFMKELLEYLGHENAYVRSSDAIAIAEAVGHWPQSIKDTLATLQDYYRDKAKILAPEYDEYGMVIAQSLDRTDPWQARVATARTFQHLAPFFSKSEVESFFQFLIRDEALGDRTSEVRKGMLTAGTAVIDIHGASCIAELIAMFEKHLAQPSPATETGDHIKEAVVILFGRVARHLDASDARVPTIVNRLVEALKTPSEQVQIAVSECLSPLVKIMGSKIDTLIDDLLEDMFNSPKYGIRRGAAYGLAGVIKGTGISGMKRFEIINRLKAATEDKKRYEPRQGAMFAFETLSSTLGRLFEPYITFVLPMLLSLFGDSTPDVREATQDAARVIMGNLSGYGVKLILPSLLSGLDEKQWRTKKGSIELLGMMAYCSPRQLSVSLPIVIPRLTGVLTDSHAQVKTAANKSLKQFGEVISNPEIQSLVPILLKALVDPGKTPNALSGLLKTSFMHYIDHSSLALVIPIIERGLRERGADTKKKAAQIVGNLASLTDSKDFVPYLSELLPLVHVVLVDPVPEARATAAKALGTLVERLGEGHFPDLVPGLLRTLKTDTSGVDRQGAAQGLSEVLSGLGMERLEGLLPDIIANAQSPRATVREGFMSLLVFLPATFGTRFQPHLPKIIGPILSGLSDTEEYVREAAMRAGRMVITNYSSKAIDLLLPELERGMFDPGWRIRHASITLVGELLFKVSGISGKPSDIDDEEEGAAEATTADASRRALVEVLGVERRDRLLSALYLVRQDGVVTVRQSSIQIWKALVNNTPRTVREILPELINQIVSLISSSEFEQEETASRTVAELCRKFGERILGEIVPLLRSKASSTDPRSREGVCLVLCSIMENSTDTQREDHEDDIISMVRVCLVDDEANVRSAAAKAFDMLQEHVGAKAIDNTIPTLLEALRQPGKGSGTALEALREVMSVRATTVFPVLIPTLTAIPMTVFNARALGSLVTVAGNALSKRLTAILGSLVKVVEEDQNEELQQAVDEALRALLGSINDAEGLNTLMMILLGWIKHDSPKRRVSGLNFFALFCEESSLDASLYRVDWIRQLIPSMEDSQGEVYMAAQRALDVFVKSLPKDELEPLVVPLRRSIESTGTPGQHVDVPGFSLPKGIAPMVPIIIAGLTTGSNEQREAASYAIGDLVERTAPESFKPFVVPFTGPLIRVATQATTYPPQVKTGILSALTSMLERIPLFVKPFFPQLQRTFVKSASDPTSVIVRTRAAKALGVLMRNQPRVDPVVTELIGGIKGGEDGIASSLILALANVVEGAQNNVGEKAREQCVEVVSDAFKEPHDESYAQSVGALVVALSICSDLLQPIVSHYLVGGTPPSLMSSNVILAVLEASEDAPEKNVFKKLGVISEVAQKVKESCANEKPNIARPARQARDLLEK
ncbi:ARM repeat-containing protein [Dendrothele bispora CBS 962.96]|uniref:ARM repeat-containing protein n=1 Tax=Dendrothele bispora (strain CBS 962.96) TaxID=1314807 RepID=A0A4V6T5H5_DENBC|nr:ARM repeat-containing protein [Dendrothele bispora CBS 962.96]